MGEWVMFRLKIVLIVLGGFVAFWGSQEWMVSRGASAKPQVIELVELEKNPTISNNHLEIGSHTALYPVCVYEYQMKKGDTGDPTAKTKVNHTYYPIISNDHPYLQQLKTLKQKYGHLDKVPDKEWPELNKFTVLVKTRSYKTVGSIPIDWVEEQKIQGLVINRIHSLKGKERDLVQRSFPKMNLDKILILEAGRKPASIAKSGGIMAGGVLMILAGVGSFFMGARKE